LERLLGEKKVAEGHKGEKEVATLVRPKKLCIGAGLLLTMAEDEQEERKDI